MRTWRGNRSRKFDGVAQRGLRKISCEPVGDKPARRTGLSQTLRKSHERREPALFSGFICLREPKTEREKPTESGDPRGWDAAKRLKGRKRHVAVDTDGLDADGLGDLLKRVKPLYVWLRAVFADSIYNRLAALLACYLAGLVLIIVRRPAGTTGFVVQPRRWVVERSLGWFGRWRRLSKDYETLPEVSEAMVTLAAIRLMLHRLAHPNRRRLPAP